MQTEKSEFKLKSIAAVVPRFGKEIGGGAETLVRKILEEIVSSKGDAVKVEVWTTCAVDHRTWANEKPEGATEEGGILVRRFPVDERDLEVFIQHELALQHQHFLSVDQQLEWLSNSVNSKALYSYIFQNGESFDAILFAPYLFATSFWGAMIHPDRSVLIPCLHDEAYAYLDVFESVFQSVRGLMFNASAEQELAASLYEVSDFNEKSCVVGMGFKLDAVKSAKSSVKSVEKSPYILYSGRKETGKNLDLLISWFVTYKERYPDSPVSLRLMGSGEIEFLSELPEGVLDEGFVSEEKKRELMGDALILCQPSTNESFSIVMMEAWREETPVLVHADCAVTLEHVTRSNGGLYCRSGEEFSEIINTLLKDMDLVKALGQSGRRYVETEYCWDAVMKRFYQGIEKIFSTSEGDSLGEGRSRRDESQKENR